MRRKRVSILVAIFAGVYGFAFSQQKPQSKSTPASKLTIAKADIETGKQLISKSDCFACHKEQDKLVGPSYKQIADKYSLSVSNLELLSSKIKEGGKGVWGQIPMSPHPTLTKDETNMMVKYIMSLKSGK